MNSSIKEKLKSVQFRMFLIMSISTLLVVITLILINNFVLESFYKYSKVEAAEKIRDNINSYYNSSSSYFTSNEVQKLEFKEIETKNNMDIFIEDGDENIIYIGNRDMMESVDKAKKSTETKTIYKNSCLKIKYLDLSTYNKSMMLISKLDNGYMIFIKIPVAPIIETVRISNKTLLLVGIVIITIAAIMSSFISKKFTKPITTLNNITKKMANLDFSEKFRITSDDEVNVLGNNINIMSDKLEKTINQLRKNNNELERDIEEKLKIDEMRKQFISDVSHELKTPIGLIQGYSEGLIENVNEDEESRKFYAEVIADEASKMDLMVKQLLELMKLEHQERKFDDTEFDLNELIKEELRRETIRIKENNITVEFENNGEMLVNCDQECIEQVLNNYVTNAIKNCEEVDGKKLIKIYTKLRENGKIRLYVFNTGKNISEDKINKIWGRFYKIDSARSREKGGTGIGLALVKAIMNNYKNEFGVTNLKNGVEFFCDLNR